MKELHYYFSLNAIMASVIDSLEGTFEKSAKYKFNKIRNSTNQLQKELLRNCGDSAHETYHKSVMAVSQILNKSIDAYNNGTIGEFLEYVEKFKT